jgi:hypothetical protein
MKKIRNEDSKSPAKEIPELKLIRPENRIQRRSNLRKPPPKN